MLQSKEPQVISPRGSKLVTIETKTSGSKLLKNRNCNLLIKLEIEKLIGKIPRFISEPMYLFQSCCTEREGNNRVILTDELDNFIVNDVELFMRKKTLENGFLEPETVIGQDVSDFIPALFRADIVHNEPYFFRIRSHFGKPHRSQRYNH